MANLETTLSADGDYSGFPRFSSPHELAAALKDAGFNIVTTANNHSLDRGARGVERTLDFLEEQGFVTRGTARTAEEAAELTIVERNTSASGCSPTPTARTASRCRKTSRGSSS